MTEENGGREREGRRRRRRRKRKMRIRIRKSPLCVPGMDFLTAMECLPEAGLWTGRGQKRLEAMNWVSSILFLKEEK